jgi:DNA mismatch endonuclease, patch repair protein
MSSETRSRVMARIRGKNTGPELILANALANHGLVWESHAPDLPGRPDFVFRQSKVAVFVDGDFWHGWKFGQWRHKLSEKWELKISSNRRRDRLNDRTLREMGWQTIRIWEHQIEVSLVRSSRRVLRAVARASAEADNRGRVDFSLDARQRVKEAGDGVVNGDQGA